LKAKESLTKQTQNLTNHANQRTIRSTRSSIESIFDKPSLSSAVKSTNRFLSCKADQMVHDVELKSGRLNQVKSSSSGNPKDLSDGVFEGTFLVEKGIELRTYFGKKIAHFKKNRQIQKTSRNEFDDLISMMEIDERSTLILEKFFERKNYFTFF